MLQWSPRDMIIGRDDGSVIKADREVALQSAHSLHSDGRASAANMSEGTAPTWSELPDEHDVVYVAPLCTEVDGIGRAKVAGGISVDEEEL